MTRLPSFMLVFILLLSSKGMASQPELALKLDLAINILVKKIGISKEDITVVSVDKVVWRNAALGCPKPDVSYPSVMTEGLLIKLKAKGKVYRFHGNRTNKLFICKSGAYEEPYTGAHRGVEYE